MALDNIKILIRENMPIFDVFDAVIDGTFKDFKQFYTGDINQIDKDLGLNLLCAVATNDEQPAEKLKIIEFLLDAGIDMTYTTRKHHRNALHVFYNCVWEPTVEYENQVTNLLIEHGIDINQVDKYQAVPLIYAITNNFLTTDENQLMYKTLLNAGLNYKLKDVFGKTTTDYAKEDVERNGFLDLIKAFELEQ